MIKNPSELKGLGPESLSRLAEDIRQRILTVTLKNGGHLGASLGTVELAIALHRVFDSPREPIIWDVGHQAYAHKLLTGRWKEFDSLRTTGGISGFLSRAESEHDLFGAGHSSTSLSVALASAWARAREAREEWTVAVIGDGALTAGLAFEALNNINSLMTAGDRSLAPLLIVLNDNQMSISPNQGAIAALLGSGKAQELFGLFGLDYVGPIDGHDLPQLIGTLQGVRENWKGRPVLLHAITQKGKGYGPAESRPASFHGVSPLQDQKQDPKREKAPGKTSAPKKRTFSDAFGEAACALAAKDPKVVAITAAMPEGTGLSEFARRFPDRFFDVGIAEPHAVLFAAGLAVQGYNPIVAIYSTFLQRALDEVIHDAALQKLGVTLVVDRAGLVGADGPTHHGMFDLAYLGMVPELSIAAPLALSDVPTWLDRAVSSGTPWAIRIPRGSGWERVPSEAKERELENPEAIVVALGSAAPRAFEAVRKVDPSGDRVRFFGIAQAKPFAPELLEALRESSEIPVLFVEDGVKRGGVGQSLLAEVMPRPAAFEIAGFEDRFYPHGAVSDLEKMAGMSAEALARKLAAMIASSAD